MPRTKKPTISPAQGLLLLLAHYKRDSVKFNSLKTWYLNGAECPEDIAEIRLMLSDPALCMYSITFDAQTIDQDPTRRYFETHLAYETLKNGLLKISLFDLELHCIYLKERLLPQVQSVADMVFNHEIDDTAPEEIKEYANYLANIPFIFSDFSTEQHEKIALLVKCSYLSVLNARTTDMPLDLYLKNIFSTKSRGRFIKSDQRSTRNQHLGLMKGHMPLAQDDIAYSPSIFPYLKPSDQASFVEGRAWTNWNFNHLVHPFSNSISGTMLCQLRAHFTLEEQGKAVFMESAKKFADYIQLSTSVMVFGTGGHTLNEFVAPLYITDIQDAFAHIVGFEDINLNSLFLEENEKAFHEALRDTVKYNDALLTKHRLNSEIREFKLAKLNHIPLSELEARRRQVSLHQMQSLITAHEQYIEQQWFGLYRLGYQKHFLILMAINKATPQIEAGNLHQAYQTIKNLKTGLINEFGETTIWGEKTKEIELLEELEDYLLHQSRKKFSFFSSRALCATLNTFEDMKDSSQRPGVS